MLKRNEIALFWEINQWDQVNQKYSCTIMAPINAIKYNTWIKLTEVDADIIINEQIRKWLLDPTSWWRWSDWIVAVNNYLEKNLKKRVKVAHIKSDNFKKINEYLDLWYMITISIKVDWDFIKDVKDWKIDEKDYIKYKDEKTYWHFTNIFKWKWRFCEWCEKLEDYDRIWIYDSYAFNSKGREWIYWDLSLEELEKISQKYFYLLYI